MQGYGHRYHSPISLTLPLSNPSDLASQQLQLSGSAAMRASVIRKQVSPQLELELLLPFPDGEDEEEAGSAPSSNLE